MKKKEILKKANKIIEDGQFYETCMAAFICPKCGSDNIVSHINGITHENRFRCYDCGYQIKPLLSDKEKGGDE